MKPTYFSKYFLLFFRLPLYFLGEKYFKLYIILFPFLLMFFWYCTSKNIVEVNNMPLKSITMGKTETYSHSIHVCDHILCVQSYSMV